MKKIIAAIAAVVILAILGALGINIFRNMGPRDREKAENGSTLVVEELSWYNHGEKQGGKVWKPGDENGNFSDSLGTRPVAMFFHDPVKGAYAESIVKRLASQGVIGYTTSCPEKSKDIESLIKRMGKQSFADQDRIFIIADTYAADAVVKAMLNVGRKTAGLVLIEPMLQGKSAVTAKRYGNEILSISPEQKGEAFSLMEDYMELRGAFK